MLDSMGCDPGLDLVEPESEVTPEAITGDRVAVTPTGAPVDERLLDLHQLGDLIDTEITRWKQVQLLLDGLRSIPTAHRLFQGGVRSMHP